METEIGVIMLQAKGCLGLPETARGKEGFSPIAFGDSTVLTHLDFRWLASRTVRINFSVLGHQVCGNLLHSPRKLGLKPVD